MSKKKKRKVSKGSSIKKTVSISKGKNVSRHSALQSFNPDYSYVIKDLHRIGILAGSFILILVILSYFIG